MRQALIFLLAPLLISAPAHAGPRAPRSHPGDHPAPLKLDDESRLRAAIDSFTLIITKTKPGSVRNKLILDRAKTELALVQVRLLKSKTLSNDKYGLLLNQSATRDSEFVANDPSCTKQMRAQSLFLQGVAEDDQDQIDEAMAKFQNSLKLDPTSPDAGWMGFYIAEELFERKQFKEAIATYRAYYNRWNPRTKRLVLYKMAWAYIDLDKIVDSENFFTTIIRTGAHDDIEKDSIRDLAYVCSKFQPEKQILSLADKTFKTDTGKMQFLRAVYDQQESQGIAANRSLIFATMLKTEKDPVERIKLKIRALSGMQTLFASVAPYRAYLEIKQMIEHASLRPDSKDFDSIRPALETESERLIRAYVDTFSGKAQSPEKISHEDLGKSLGLLFSTYDSYFPKSKVRGSIFSLWFDVCIDLKDWACVNRVALEVPRDPQLTSLQSRAEIERLAALDELVKSDSAHFRPDLVKAAENFFENHPKDPRWVSVTNRLADLKLEDKKNDDAIRLLEAVYKTSPSQSAFYRLQWARFSDEKYQDILADQGNSNVKEKPDPRLSDLYRESALKLALKARSSGDLATYTKEIENFFRYNNDSKKAEVARRDYISFLLDKNELVTAQKTLSNLKERCSSQFSDLLSDLCVRKMRQGSFNDVYEILSARSCQSDPALLNLWLLASIASGKRIKSDELKRLPSPKREYILSLLALTDPELVLSFIKKHGAADDAETSAKQIALRLNRGQWDNPSPKPDLRLTSVEKSIARIRIPKIPKKRSKKAEQRFALELKSIVELIPRIRAGVTHDLKGKAPEVQLRILNTAGNLEDSVAEVILGSPIPDGLSQEQQKQYKDSIAGIAKGYSDQSLEYRKLAQTAQQVIDTEIKRQQNLVIARPATDKWPWPNCPAVHLIRDAVSKGNVPAALLLADLNRESQLKADPDYYRSREGILLYGFSGRGTPYQQVMQRYVLEELNASHREDVIQQWRALSK